MRGHGSWQKLKRLTCVPDFDRASFARRHDLGPIRRIRDRCHANIAKHVCVCVRLLFARLELQSACEGWLLLALTEAWQLEKAITCVPNFDRVVIGAGDDRLTVRSEGNGGDAVAVGALLARLELESACK